MDVTAEEMEKRVARWGSDLDPPHYQRPTHGKPRMG